MLDFRLVFIPAFFILLRMWTCITNILFTYVGVNPDRLPSRVSLALIILSVSCSAQLHDHSATPLYVVLSHLNTITDKNRLISLGFHYEKLTTSLY